MTGGRIDKLARRVRWLDHYRRIIAVLCAMLLAPLLIADLGDRLGTTWPHLHALALSGVVGFVVWAMAEVLLAWVAAVWETEHSQLTRDRGLPQAYVIRRK